MRQKNNSLIIFINLMFFQVGLMMSIISAIIPEIIEDFNISYGLAAVLPFAFYFAIGTMSVPTGLANEKFSAKRILLFSFLFSMIGVFLFVLVLSYWASILSLFIIGSSVAIIQVTSIPLLRRACGPENLSFNSTLNQLMYGLGAFSGPVIYSYLSTNLVDDTIEKNILIRTLSLLVPQGYEWISTYWLAAVLLLSLVIILFFIKFPKRSDSQKHDLAKKDIYQELFSNKYVILYFFSLIAYASCEQGIAAWMSKFFQDYHGYNPQLEGASILSFYWLLLTVGCLGGMLLLKFYDSRKVLAFHSVMAIISLSLALYGGPTISKIAFPMVGAFESVMWPVILSLAINSVSRYHDVLSGFMFTASLGGALGPVIIGNSADAFGLRISLTYLYLPLVVVLSVAFWAKPIITNRTVQSSKTVIS